MHRFVCLAVAALLCGPQLAYAQMQPHRAEYVLRLGNAANAPRIGTAVQDISQDCAGWHLKRDIASEIALTASWKMALSSKLDAEETRSGNNLRYRTVQVQNGNTRETKGRVQKDGGELRTEIVQPGVPPFQFSLPNATLLPVAAIDHLIERLRANATAFPALTFDPEVVGDVFLVDVTQLGDDRLRPAGRPTSRSRSQGKVVASGHELHPWPPAGTETHVFRDGPVFENGVLDRLTVDTGLVTVTADLQTLEMRPAPNCPRS